MLVIVPRQPTGPAASQAEYRGSSPRTRSIQIPADSTFGPKADACAWLASIETELSSGRHLSPDAGREHFGDTAGCSQSGRHSNTVAKIYRVFRTMMDTTVDDGRLRTNPVQLARVSSH
jgi:hypothetical protein